MARSAVNDPLERFRFLVTFSLPNGDDPVRTGFHDIQMPKRATNEILYREGQDADISTKSAGLNTFENIVMSRGVIAQDGDAANDFYKWIRAVHNPTTGTSSHTTTSAASSTGSNIYRADVTIKMLGRDGIVERAWQLYQAFPTNFVPGSDLAASEDGEKSLEQLTLTYEEFQEMKADEPTTAL